MELDRNLLRKLRDDPLGSGEAAMDEVMEIYAQSAWPSARHQRCEVLLHSHPHE